jgi:hypothetical protein
MEYREKKGCKIRMSTIRDQERDKGEGKGTRENQSG